MFELEGAQVTPEPPPPPVVHVVFFDVLLVGFIPGVAGEFWLALPVVLVSVVTEAEALLWPGAFSEFPGETVASEGCAAASAWDLPLSFPLPLPARAEPANAVRKIASTSVPRIPAVRFVMSFSPRKGTICPYGPYGS